MPIFTGAVSLLKGLLLCLSISSALGTEILLVKYPKAVLKKQEGEALHRNCTVIYDQTKCKNLFALWCKFDAHDSCIELTDGMKYHIQLSEMTLEAQSDRSRLITMSIEHLTLQDSGRFQCNADCGSGVGLSAKGNYIHLSVSKADPKRNSPRNSGIHRVEVIPVILHFLFLFVSGTPHLC